MLLKWGYNIMELVMSHKSPDSSFADSFMPLSSNHSSVTSTLLLVVCGLCLQWCPYCQKVWLQVSMLGVLRQLSNAGKTA